MHVFPLSTHKQRILSHFIHNSAAMFFLKTLNPGGIRTRVSLESFMYVESIRTRVRPICQRLKSAIR
jgi:hypothetical protein